MLVRPSCVVSTASNKKHNTINQSNKRESLEWSHTHNRLTALFPGLPRWAGTRKVKPVWILMKQETVRGSGISWAICKSTPRSRQITTPRNTSTPSISFFTGWITFLLPNQQYQSTKGKFKPEELNWKKIRISVCSKLSLLNTCTLRWLFASWQLNWTEPSGSLQCSYR